MPVAALAEHGSSATFLNLIMKTPWLLPRLSSVSDFIFNSGEWYYKTGGSIDFYKPGETYNKEDIVLYKNKYWKSLID
jgi:hypothetical protein